MPNGRSSVLERQQGADADGYSGLEDEVDNHWAELFKAALLSTILGVGAELGSGADSGSNTDILRALRLSAANSLNQTGQRGPSKSEHSTDLDDPPWIPGESGCQSRSRSRTLQGLNPMSKLKLNTPDDHKPVKVTHELSAAVHRDLVIYAEILARASHEERHFRISP
jgi:hypothetical protein